MNLKHLGLIPLLFFSVLVEARQDIQTLSLSDAIVTRNVNCHYEGGVLHYDGVIKNLSQYSSYKVSLVADFLFKKNGREFDSWGKSENVYMLKPFASYAFSFKSRIAPKSFEMKCSHHISGYFVSSTLKK